MWFLSIFRSPFLAKLLIGGLIVGVIVIQEKRLIDAKAEQKTQKQALQMAANEIKNANKRIAAQRRAALTALDVSRRAVAKAHLRAETLKKLLAEEREDNETLTMCIGHKLPDDILQQLPH